MNVPQLRFKEFSGEWEEKKLGEIGEIVTGKTPSTTDINLWNGEIKFITPTDIDDNVKYQSITQRTVVKQNKMKVLPIGSISYTCIASIGKMQLTIHPSITNQQINSIIVNINHNNEFIYYSLLNMTPYIKSTQSNTTLPIINKTEFSKFIVGIPSLPEQTKIANFLSSIDTKIEQLTKKETLLKEYKKRVMAQIFNQEIRFKADDGSEFSEWEKKKLGELFIYKNGGSFESDVIEDGQYKLITLNSIDINGELKLEHKRVNINDNSLSKNDLIMVLSDVAHGNFLGLTAIIPEDNVYVLNQRMGALKPKTNNNISFIRFYINFNQKYFKLHGQGSSQQNLSKGDIEKFIINIPCLAEQTKIANFLSSIDSKIEQVQKQLSSTKEFKKALLQQMFV